MIRPMILSAALLIATLPVTSAWAASEDGGDKPKTEVPGVSKGDHQAKGDEGRDLERMDQFASYLDSKADDKDSAAKWAALEKRLKEKRPDEFKRLDSDNDGTLSRAEITSALEKAQAAFKEHHPELFDKIDSDHDGKLTAAEIRAAREKHRGEAHAKGDAPKGDAPKDGGSDPAPAK